MEPGLLLFKSDQPRGEREKEASSALLPLLRVGTVHCCVPLHWEPGCSNTFASLAPICGPLLASHSWVMLKHAEADTVAAQCFCGKNSFQQNGRWQITKKGDQRDQKVWAIPRVPP